MPSPFVVHDASFLDVLGPAPSLVKLVDAPAHEGPVYVEDEHAVYATSTPTADHASSVLRIDLDSGSDVDARGFTVVAAGTAGANGMTLAADGGLLVCMQGNLTTPAAIARLDRGTGELSNVVTAWGGVALNSPNDIVVRRDGTVWFTDPSYGHLQGFRPPPQAGDHVYRLDPGTGLLTVVADELDKPNGLAFSPDERTLYVTDSGANQEAGSFHPSRPHHVLAYDVVDGRHLANRRLLYVVNPGFPDGLKVDAAGRVYVSAYDGVHVLSAAGNLLGRISLDGAVNFCFGGRQRNVLYVTADNAVWAVVLATTGPTLPQPRAAATARTPQGAPA